MTQLIEKLPAVPTEIIEAVSNDTLAIFIGAGVSRIIGCDGWDELAKRLIDKCFSLSIINYREKISLGEETDHKKTITICRHILNQAHFEDSFYAELNNAVSGKQSLLKSQNIYHDLLDLHGLFITTNIDTHFDKEFNVSRVVFRPDDFDYRTIDRTYLYHIHGSLIDPSSLVLTTPEYIERYRLPNFVMFLKQIFRSYTVLFVGYGLNEFEMLDFVIEKSEVSVDIKRKHFILLPYYSREDNMVKFDQSYYGPMGISVIGFEKDEKGYAQLYDVIKFWNEEINQTSTYLYDSLNFIKQVVNDYDGK